MTTTVETDIHVGDIGTILIVAFVEDGNVFPITSGSPLVNQIGLKKPSKKEVWVDAGFLTDGSDGKIKYVVHDASFFDEAGTWYITGKCQTADGKWIATARAFKVRSSFET